jgi:hypothetical protein
MADGSFYRFLYASFGLLVGLAFLAGGLVRHRRRQLSKTDPWTFQLGPLQVKDAAPDLGLALLGAAIIYFTRF